MTSMKRFIIIIPNTRFDVLYYDSIEEAQAAAEKKAMEFMTDEERNSNHVEIPIYEYKGAVTAREKITTEFVKPS